MVKMSPFARTDSANILLEKKMYLNMKQRSSLILRDPKTLTHRKQNKHMESKI